MRVHITHVCDIYKDKRMTRKDFTLIAKVVSSLDDMSVRNYVGVAFAHKLQEVNPRFNVSKFLEACECES